MNFLHRGRILLPWAAVVLLMSACSDDTSTSPEPSASSSTASADPAAEDESTVAALYAKFWKIRIASENSATIDDDTYAGVLTGPDLEAQGRKIDQYQSRDLVRVGKPTISNVAVTVSGDKAKILACQDEDDWRAEIDGKAIPAPEVLGNVGTGATAERRDGAWIITALDEGDDSRCS